MKSTLGLMKAAVCAVFVWTIEVHAQNLIVNGTFATPTVTQSEKWGFFPAAELWPWQTQESSFELWTNGLVAPGAYVTNAAYSADGCTQNIEIAAQAGTNTVWQTVPTVNGETYYFSFYHTPRPHYSSQLTVSINSKVVTSIYENAAGLTNFAWQQFSTKFVATSNQTTVAFTDAAITFPSTGAHLDAVVLEHIPRLNLNRVSANELTGSWLGVSNEIYQLQYSTNLCSTNWISWGSSMQTNATTAFHFTDTITNAPQKFYRVVVGP